MPPSGRFGGILLPAIFLAALALYCAQVAAAPPPPPKPSKADQVISDIARSSANEVKAILNTVGRYQKLNTTMRWKDALLYCEKKGERLCRYKEYCPEGKEKKPAGGNQVGEAWAPVSDENNDWVFIGDDITRTCQLYSALHHNSLPPWGTIDEPRLFKTNFLCCPMKMQRVKLKKSKNNSPAGPTWDEVSEICERQPGMRLCRRDEYCPDGRGQAPVGGILFQAAWAAVFDRRNEWVAVGQAFPKRLSCTTFREIAPDKVPLWNKDPLPARSVVKCCPDSFFNVKGKLSYKNAISFCMQKKLRLCNQDEYCPKGGGPGTQPRGGGRSGTAWAPIGDDVNEWISVGLADPNKMCLTHTSIMDKKPDWGLSTGTRGYLQCCEIIWHMLQRKVTYAQADKFCTDRGERLCKLDEYCIFGPSKPPRGGALTAENNVAWAPIFDTWNNWVFVSKDPAKLCQTYRKLHGKLPDWGTTTGFTGTVQCCKNDGSERLPPRPVSNKTRNNGTALETQKVNATATALNASALTANVTKIPKAKTQIVLPKSPIAENVKKIQADRNANEALTKMTKKNEHLEKMMRAEEHSKIYERYYWNNEKKRKKSGEDGFKQAYKKTVVDIGNSMHRAVEKAKAVLEAAQRKHKEKSAPAPSKADYAAIETVRADPPLPGAPHFRQTLSPSTHPLTLSRRKKKLSPRLEAATSVIPSSSSSLTSSHLSSIFSPNNAHKLEKSTMGPKSVDDDGSNEPDPDENGVQAPLRR